MLASFGHLVAESWAAMVKATGTSTLGFIIWTVALAAASWFATVIQQAMSLRSKGTPHPFQTSFVQSLSTGLYTAGAVFILTLVAWSIFGVITIYQDHVSLVAKNLELGKTISSLQQDKSNLANQIAFQPIPTGRFLTTQQIDDGVQALRQFNKRGIIGIATGRDYESMGYALQLAQVFRKSGWTPLLYCVSKFEQDQQGIVLPWHSQSNMPSRDPLKAVLDAMGIKYALPDDPINAQAYPISSTPCELRPMNRDGSPWDRFGSSNLSTDDLAFYVGSK